MRHAALCIASTALLVALVLVGLTRIIRATQPTPQPQGDTRDLIAENDRLEHQAATDHETIVSLTQESATLRRERNEARMQLRQSTSQP